VRNLRKHPWSIPQSWIAVDLQQPGVACAVHHDVYTEQIEAALTCLVSERKQVCVEEFQRRFRFKISPKVTWDLRNFPLMLATTLRSIASS
jgi:hypothetical protein